MYKISFISYCITWLVFPHRANKKIAKYREEKRQQQHLKCIFCFSIIISIEFFFIVKHRRSLPKIFRCRILCALCIHYTVYTYTITESALKKFILVPFVSSSTKVVWNFALNLQRWLDSGNVYQISARDYSFFYRLTFTIFVFDWMMIFLLSKIFASVSLDNSMYVQQNSWIT